MAKVSSVFVCKECGFESPKPLGKCPCGAWNSFYEQKIEKANTNEKIVTTKDDNLPKQLSTPINEKQERIKTGFETFNEVLGGGLLRGSASLISGEPGIGKSTLLLQTAINIAETKKVLYVSGEESFEQIKGRANRIINEYNQGKDIYENLFIFSETNLEKIFAEILNDDYSLIIVDSIQTVYSKKIETLKGGVSQIKEVTFSLVELAKKTNVPIILVAHITKQGDIAGPKIIEHLVDTVLYFTGERLSEIRILSSVKNRFGRTGEISAFEMREDGLKEVLDISSILIEERSEKNIGVICSATIEGSKAVLFELQALESSSENNYPKRITEGLPLNRLNMLIAISENCLELNFIEKDVYVNIIGDIKPEGRFLDLAAILTLYSINKRIEIDSDILAVGEVSLSGEVRYVASIEKIIKESIRMGFKKIIIPKKNFEKLNLADFKGANIFSVSSIKDAIKVMLS